MAFPEEIADGLPAPRDDEPASLRRDIVDELSDHLHCALNRELHQIDNETQAKQNVISRFGDPARIAYRLWFDAMKEKIMSQRITLAAAAIVAIACLFVAAMAWQMSQQSRETNLAILDKLSVLATQQERHKSLDWNPVKIRLVSDDENGPPAVGFKGTLFNRPSGGLGGFTGSAASSEMPTIEEVSGSDGVIDFGLVRFGTYSINIVSPWQESGGIWITVRPGQSFSTTIICPSEPAKVDIGIEIDWPDDLKKGKLWATCTIGIESPRLEQPTKDQAGIGWDYPYFSLPFRSALLTDSGTIITSPEWGAFDPYSGNRLTVRQTTPSPHLEVIARPMQLLLVRVVAHPQTGSDGKIVLPKQPLASFHFNSRPSGFSGPFGGGGGGGGFMGSSGLVKGSPDTSEPSAGEAKLIAGPKFEPKPGEVNRWKITLPDELVAYLREQLAPQDAVVLPAG